jgi:cystathionine beta-lyase/cystathionine gamma-synthase
MCEARLQAFCGQANTADSVAPSAAEVATFNAHLQTMSGTDVDTAANPVTFAAGLPAIASIWLTLVKNGGANILMCSTAYGGSSELTDIFHARGGKLSKSKFDIQVIACLPR